jgi:hypothetical protein
MIFATVHFHLAEDLDLLLAADLAFGGGAARRLDRGLAAALLRLPSTERPPASIILA